MKKRSLRIFIGGATPYADNRGVSAIFNGLIMFFRQLTTCNFKLFIWHSYPESFERYTKNRATARSAFQSDQGDLDFAVISYKVPRIQLHAILESTVKLLCSIAVLIITRFLLVFNIKPRFKNAVLSEVLSCDFIIEMNFGDVFNDVYYGKILYYYNSLRFVFEILSNKPIYLFPQSIGPFKTFLGRILAKWLLNHTRMIAVRELHSLKYGLALGIDKAKLLVAPDMGFWSPINSPSDSINLLHENGVDPTQQKLLAVILSKKIFSDDNSKLTYDSLSEVLSNVLHRPDVSVVFICHGLSLNCDKAGKLCNSLVYEKLKEKKRAFLIQRDYSVEELWGIIGQCDVVFTSLTHPVIASLKQDVPVLSLGYSHKTLGILERFGMSKYLVECKNFNINQTTQLLNEVINKSVEIKVQLTYYNRFVDKAKIDFQQTFEQILNEL